MLISLVALLRAQRPGAVPLTTGELMQGALFRRLAAISSRATDILHGSGESAPRPYTISPLMLEHEQTRGRSLVIAEGDPAWFRVTGLTAGVADLLAAMADSTSTWPLFGEGVQADFRITQWRARPEEHPWCGQIHYEELWQASYRDMQKQPDRIWFDFETPTGFIGGETWPDWSHLPLPQLVFGSLAGKQRSHLASLGEAPAEIERLAALGAYQTRSHSLRFAKHGSMVSGFTGSCEYLIHPGTDEQTAFWLHLLAGFAFYSGTGWKTSWGMGMTRRSRYREFGYRGD